jgi:hypothetical protein
MRSFTKSAALATVLLAAVGANANADEQVAGASITAGAAVTLPEVVVHPPQDYYDPYTSGRSQHASSLNHIVAPHFKVPVGYDADVTMHPYTSLLGPCTEGNQPAQGCRHPTGTPITPSHYERPPFNQ